MIVPNLHVLTVRGSGRGRGRGAGHVRDPARRGRRRAHPADHRRLGRGRRHGHLHLLPGRRLDGAAGAPEGRRHDPLATPAPSGARPRSPASGRSSSSAAATASAASTRSPGRSQPPGTASIALLEARSAYLLFWEDRLADVAERVIVVTRDGSRGLQGPRDAPRRDPERSRASARPRHRPRLHVPDDDGGRADAAARRPDHGEHEPDHDRRHGDVRRLPPDGRPAAGSSPAWTARSSTATRSTGTRSWRGARATRPKRWRRCAAAAAHVPLLRRGRGERDPTMAHTADSTSGERPAADAQAGPGRARAATSTRSRSATRPRRPGARPRAAWPARSRSASTAVRWASTSRRSSSCIVDGDFGRRHREAQGDQRPARRLRPRLPAGGAVREHCVLGKKGAPVAIGRLERFLADWEAEQGADRSLPGSRRPTAGASPWSAPARPASPWPPTSPARLRGHASSRRCTRPAAS